MMERRIGSRNYRTSVSQFWNSFVSSWAFNLNPLIRAKCTIFTEQIMHGASWNGYVAIMFVFHHFLGQYQRSAQMEQDVDPLGHSASQTKCGFVLTKAEVQAIREDILNLTRPSWFTSVPSQLGHASHGKLKADQWRVLGTTFLPISLIRLWSDLDVNDLRAVRCRKIVKLTLDLLSAVIIATSRTTSSAHVRAYQQHMQDYLVRLKDLFPDYKFHPNHHMALHLAEYIALFGPVHSWWAFPFKRIIGMLQHISTNYKPGEFGCL